MDGLIPAEAIGLCACVGLTNCHLGPHCAHILQSSVKEYFETNPDVSVLIIATRMTCHPSVPLPCQGRNMGLVFMRGEECDIRNKATIISLNE